MKPAHEETSLNLEDLLVSHFAEEAFEKATGRTSQCLPMWALAEAPTAGLTREQYKHAKGCKACQNSLALSMQLTHPSKELLTTYAEGKSPIAAAIREHVETQGCAECHIALVPLRIQAERKKTGRIFGNDGILLILLAGFAGWLTTSLYQNAVPVPQGKGRRGEVKAEAIGDELVVHIGPGPDRVALISSDPGQRSVLSTRADDGAFHFPNRPGQFILVRDEGPKAGGK